MSARDLNVRIIVITACVFLNVQGLAAQVPAVAPAQRKPGVFSFKSGELPGTGLGKREHGGEGKKGS